MELSPLLIVIIPDLTRCVSTFPGTRLSCCWAPGLAGGETDHGPHLEIPHTIPHSSMFNQFKHETLTQDRSVKTQAYVCQVLALFQY
jgi:hypothetical protein